MKKTLTLVSLPLLGFVKTSQAKYAQLEHGLIMNWFGNQSGEGFESALFVSGLAIRILVNESGK